MERILVAGATGLLGGRIVRRLLDQARPVRALVRDRGAERARSLEQLGAELAVGDLTDADSLRRACDGVTHVISTANAFMQQRGNTPDRVDVEGTRALADAARAADVRRFLYVSAVVAEPDSMVDFYRYKYQAQEAVRASGVRYTIVRAPAFMDVWAEIILAKARAGGAATIFGDGRHPVNFIAVDDVARAVVALLDDPAAENRVVDLRGPEDLTLLEVVEAYERHVGRPMKRKHVPVPVMKVMRHVVRPFNPLLSRMISGGLHLATNRPKFAAAAASRFPQITFNEWLDRQSTA
jgi:NADH dehydrogenase